MTITTLKRSLGTDAQALTDVSYGVDGLKNVLQALAKVAGVTLKAAQATIAVAVLDGFLVEEAGDYQVMLRIEVGTTGTAGNTIVQVHKNGTLVTGATLTVANTEADGTKSALSAAIALSGLVAGDTITLEVTTAPTGGANLVASARMTPLAVE